MQFYCKNISCKKIFKEQICYNSIYIMVMKNEINNYINKTCYEYCHFKKQNMELYKLNLPNGVVNNIIEYNCDDEECIYCFCWRFDKKVIYHLYEINIRHKRNVEEDVLAFIIVYRNKLPKLEDVKQVMKISEKKYEILKHILWMLAYEDIEDVKENIKLYIESKKLNVKNTIRVLNIFVKLTYDYNKNKPHQLNYYPEIKL